MPAVLTAGVAGVLAGLAVALPLGAVGVLLLSEGMARGWRAAVAAAGGVATVDLVYAALATLTGTAVAALLAGREDVVRVVAGGVLAGVAARGLLTATRPATGVVRGAGPTPGQTRGPAAGTYWRFVLVTAVNPLTALYFVALAAGLGSRLNGAAAASAFVAGVGLGSLAWQLVLAGLGAGTGAVLGERGRYRTTVAGHVVVLVLAAVVAGGAFAS